MRLNRKNARLFVAVLALFLAATSHSLAILAPRHDFPRVGAYEVLSGDFHIHTLNSDGGLTTRGRVEETHSFGYDVMAITDHGNIRSYRIAKNVGNLLGMVILPGFETGVKDKEHYVVIGVSPSFKPTNAHGLAETSGADTRYYRDELKDIVDAGGFIFHPHPHVGYREPTDWGIKNNLISGIEVQNGLGLRDEGWGMQAFGNVWCYPHGFDWGLEHNLTLFANTDIHGPRQDAKQPVTLVFVTDRTPDAVMDAFRARRTVAWFNGMLWGREEQLSPLVAASVSVKRVNDREVEVENKCPVALKGAVSGTVIELTPYSKTRMDYSGPDSVSVKWENIWTSPKTNFVSDVKIAKG